MADKRTLMDLGRISPLEKVTLWDTDNNTVDVATRQTLMTYGLEPLVIEAGEEYMCARHLKHFRTLLLRWKETLLISGDQTMKDLKEFGEVPADMLDQAANEERFNLRLRSRDRERKLLRKIDEAITLIDSMDYGFCEECAVQIGIRRLEARPTATLCVECKTQEELRERQNR